MIHFFVITDINLLISNAKGSIQTLIDSINESTKKPLFLYGYSLFESTITEILRYYLNAFPGKLDKNITIGKSELLSSPATYDIISNSVNNYIRKYSSEALIKYLSFFEETLNITLSIDKNIVKEISQTRNNITHDNSYFELREMHIKNNSHSPAPSLLSFQEKMQYLLCMLDNIDLQISSTYQKYSYEFLLRSVWKYIFSSPLLVFDQIWEFKNGALQIKDIKQVKKRIKSISSSEHLLIAIFLQQYSNELNETLHSFRDIPPLVSIDEDTKNKIIEVITFFKYYPRIFNGEIITPTINNAR